MGRLGLGTVVDFDEHAGHGTVREDTVRDDAGRDDAGPEFFFHCTAIADGSRTIAPGTRVAFDLAPGRRGDYEAGAVTVIG